jgi:succinoglycan biosynthesis transport protein ExoP
MSAAERFERARESEGLSGALAVLRRRWLVVVGVTLACVLISVARHERAAKSYSATASVAFQSGTLPDAALQIFPSSSTEPQREANTEVLIAHSPEVAEGVRRQLNITTSPEVLLEQVQVEVAPNADILEIAATSGDPAYAAQLANSFAEQYIAFTARSELAGIASAQRNLESQIAALPAGSSERATLQQSLQRLGELRAVAGGGASIIGRATTPGSPTWKSLSSAVAIGLLIGLALAFALVFLLESLDRRIKTIEECEREYRLPALAGVPQGAFRATRADQREELLEPYRILRSALDFVAVTHRLDTLLITSAVSGEGKTTVAVDLAHTVALTGRRVVLIELDLRRPTIAAHFDLHPGRGLTSVLTGGGELMDLLVEPLPELPNFSVLPAGRLPHNPAELLGSPRIAEIIGELSGEDGIVIVDAPPLNPVADAQVLIGNPAIHAALIVARIDRVTRDEARRARAILDRHMVEPVGIVVTGLRDGSRYGYEPYGESPKAPKAGEASVEGSPRSRGSESRRLRL